MNVAKPKRRKRQLEGKLRRLEAERDAAKAKMRRNHVARDCAAFLRQIKQLDLRKLNRQQRLRLLQQSIRIRDYLRKYTARLEGRLSFALAHRKLLEVIPLVTSADTAFVFRSSAYFRDYLITCLLHFLYEVAKQDGDRGSMNRIERAQAKWDRADKGILARSQADREALTLLRRLYAYEHLRKSCRSAAFEGKLFDQIALAGPDFLRALAKAKRFRAKRQKPGGMTEETNRRADFIAYGIMCQLFEKERRDWKTLLSEMAPDWKDDPRNFQKLLRECLVPFRPVGRWRGNQQCVRGRGKNIHSERYSNQ